MNDNVTKIRNFVWDLKEGQAVTFGYIAKNWGSKLRKTLPLQSKRIMITGEIPNFRIGELFNAPQNPVLHGGEIRRSRTNAVLGLRTDLQGSVVT